MSPAGRPGPPGASSRVAGESALPPPQEVAERALLAAGTGACTVLVEERSECEARFANNAMTTNGRRRDRRVTVIRFVDRREGTCVGTASASGLSDVAELVAAAEKDADGTPPAEDASELIDAGAPPGFEEPPEMVELGPLSEVVGGLAEVFRRARTEGRVIAGFATSSRVTSYLASSTGTRRRHVQPSATLQLVGRSGDGVGSAWAGSGAEVLSAASLSRLEDRVAERLAWSQRRVELPAGRYQVLLPPDAVADLVLVLAEALSGRDAEDGRSVFSRPGGGTRVGERLSGLAFELSSDPGLPGLACAPFLLTESSGSDVSVFDNGAELGPTFWIAGGRLERLRYHRARARRSGAAFTPPVDNLSLALPGAGATLREMVARSGRCLLLTCLWYIREVDLSTLLLTGLTRDGVYLVEGGEVVAAVNNFRFNESPVDLLGRVGEVGASERALSREWGEWASRTSMPPLRVDGFNMSSVSPAS